MAEPITKAKVASITVPPSGFTIEITIDIETLAEFFEEFPSQEIADLCISNYLGIANNPEMTNALEKLSTFLRAWTNSPQYLQSQLASVLASAIARAGMESAILIQAVQAMETTPSSSN